MAGLGSGADVQSLLPVVRGAPRAPFPLSGFEASPWAGRDESAVTAGLGPQVPNVCHEVKEHGAESLLLPFAGQKLQRHRLSSGTRLLLLQPPSPRAAPSLCARRLFLAPAAVGGRKSAAQLLLCRSLSVLARTVGAIV